MGRFVLTNGEDIEWQWPSKDWKGSAPSGAPQVRYKRLGSSEQGAPNAQLVEYEPEHHEPAHSHPHDELLYILEGEGAVGEHSLKPGMLLYIERGTQYGPLEAGPRGLRFLRVQMSD